MSSDPASVHSLRRVFQQAFLVHDIAEPIVSFDESAPTDEVIKHMEQRRFEVVGVRRAGEMIGYLQFDELGSGQCSEYILPFSEEQIVADTLPLNDLVLRLKDHHRLFVSVFGTVGGIVSRSDMQKPPLRMWLFGVVTLIEMRFGRLIERFCPDGEFKDFLSDSRLQKAEDLLQERKRRNQDLNLVDCLQFSDKAQIVARNIKLRERTRFESRKRLEKSAKTIEKLRNNLAHSQDIVTNDWETIVSLSENLDRVLDGPPGLRE